MPLPLPKPPLGLNPYILIILINAPLSGLRIPSGIHYPVQSPMLLLNHWAWLCLSLDLPTSGQLP